MEEFKVIIWLVIFGFISFSLFPIEAVADGNSFSQPDVWVIGSSYENHGQTVSNIIRIKAPNANIHLENVSDKRKINLCDVAKVIPKAANNRAEVINLNIGMPGSKMPQVLAEAIDYAQEKGAATVAATPKITGKIARTMYENNIGASEATEYVIEKQGSTQIETSSPELVKKDFLLNLLTFTVGNSLLGDFSHLLKSSYKAITDSLNTHISPDIKKSKKSKKRESRYKKLPHEPSSGILAPDIVEKRGLF